MLSRKESQGKGGIAWNHSHLTKTQRLVFCFFQPTSHWDSRVRIAFSHSLSGPVSNTLTMKKPSDESQKWDEKSINGRNNQKGEEKEDLPCVNDFDHLVNPGPVFVAFVSTIWGSSHGSHDLSVFLFLSFILFLPLPLSSHWESNDTFAGRSGYFVFAAVTLSQSTDRHNCVSYYTSPTRHFMMTESCPVFGNSVTSGRGIKTFRLEIVDSRVISLSLSLSLFLSFSFSLSFHNVTIQLLLTMLRKREKETIRDTIQDIISNVSFAKVKD